MEITSTPIPGMKVLNRPIRRDERGAFTRLFGEDDLANIGFPMKVAHVNTSTSKDVGTLRGLHFQFPPFAETKVVACTSGAVWDVGVDLRPGSPTQFCWYGETLTPENGKSLIVPDGFAHGFITLEPNSTIVYVISSVYKPDYESGICFNDDLLNIDWPIQPRVVSEKDLSWGKLKNRIDEISNNFF